MCTLRASLSGTFLQTPPELVTPLKEHLVFISAQLSTDAVSAIPAKGLGANKTVEAAERPKASWFLWTLSTVFTYL